MLACTGAAPCSAANVLSWTRIMALARKWHETKSGSCTRAFTIAKVTLTDFVENPCYARAECSLGRFSHVVCANDSAVRPRQAVALACTTSRGVCANIPTDARKGHRHWWVISGYAEDMLACTKVAP